jgi:hypothetical protein
LIHFSLSLDNHHIYTHSQHTHTQIRTPKVISIIVMVLIFISTVAFLLETLPELGMRECVSE